MFCLIFTPSLVGVFGIIHVLAISYAAFILVKVIAREPLAGILTGIYSSFTPPFLALFMTAIVVVLVLLLSRTRILTTNWKKLF